MYSPLNEELLAPDIKWDGDDVRLNSSNLTNWTKTFKSLHPFVGLRNAPYPRYRNINKIEIPFWKLGMLAASQSMGAAVPYLRDDLAGTPFHDVLSVPVPSLLLGAGWNCGLVPTWKVRTHT